MGTLFDKIHGKEEADKIEQQQHPEVHKERVVTKLTAKGMLEKDKQVSAKVNSATYELFTRINKVNGLSNNSAINMLIASYVHEKKYLLDDK